MAYVDLNPIRAQMAKTPETSDHTSIKERIKPAFDIEKAVKQQQELQALRNFNLPVKPLCKFNDEDVTHDPIPFAYTDYLELVDATGRIIREGKRGFIAPDTPPILARLAMNSDQWIDCCTNFMTVYHRQFAKRRRKILRAN